MKLLFWRGTVSVTRFPVIFRFLEFSARIHRIFRFLEFVPEIFRFSLEFAVFFPLILRGILHHGICRNADFAQHLESWNLPRSH